MRKIKNPSYKSRINFSILALMIPVIFCFTACFSNWKSDEGTVVINLSGGKNGRSVEWPPSGILSQLEYKVTLTGNDETINLSARGGNVIRTTVSVGRWNVNVNANYKSEPYAEGSAYVDVKAGQNNQVLIKMNQLIFGAWAAVEDSTFTDSFIRGIAYGNGTFAAGGDKGRIAYSKDSGVTWKAVEAGTGEDQSKFLNTEDIYNLVFAHDRFFAFTYGKMVSSEDGVIWKKVEIDAFYISESFQDMAWGGGRFVAVGTGGKMAYSIDGEKWNIIVDEEDAAMGTNIYNITYGGGKFIAGLRGGYIAYSTNGENWRQVLIDTSLKDTQNDIHITYGRDKFVAGSNNIMLYSADGITWTKAASSLLSEVQGLTYGGGYFIAFTIDGQMIYSTDGVNWTESVIDAFSPPEIIVRIAYGEGKFIVAGGVEGKYGKIAYSGTASGFIEMVEIPAGTLTWGNAEITLTAFKMGKYEVTQEQYLEVMGVNPSYFRSNPADGEIQGRRPVEQVTWFDAIEFCNKLSKMEGLMQVYEITGREPEEGYPITAAIVTPTWTNNGYRLPTEAQWEYACRAGTTTDWHFGDDEDKLVDYAWYDANASSMTHEVGKKDPNRFELYDMHGNVQEWCWDWYGDYPTTAQTDYKGAVSSNGRVKRGGSWLEPGQNLLSALRNNNLPRVGYYAFGFRLVRP